MSFRTEGGKFALSFRNPQGQGPDTLEVKGGKVVTIAPGAAEAYVAGDGHHFWLKSEDRARGAGVAAYAVPAEESGGARETPQLRNKLHYSFHRWPHFLSQHR